MLIVQLVRSLKYLLYAMITDQSFSQLYRLYRYSGLRHRGCKHVATKSINCVSSILQTSSIGLLILSDSRSYHCNYRILNDNANVSVINIYPAGAL